MNDEKRERYRLAEIASADTDKVPALTGGHNKAVSYDMCARINALINPKWSSITIWVETHDTHGAARVVSMVPSNTAGYLYVLCDTTSLGRVTLEVSAQYSFDLRIQNR